MAENKKKDAIDPFSEKEIETLINNATGYLKNYIALSYLLGTRPSELINVTWSRVNFEEKYIIILGAITGKETDEERDLNKSFSSTYRKIFLSDKSIFFLKQQARLTQDKNSYIFLNQTNQMFRDVHAIRVKFNKLLEKTGIRKRRMYDLRHSFASVNLSKNTLPLNYISRQMGHADINITLKKYTAYIANSDFDTFDMLNKAFESLKVED